MAIVVASGSAVSVSSASKSSDQVTGRNQYVGKGKIQLVAKASATGMNYTLNVGGVALVDDSPNAFTGTAGTLSVKDNVIVEQMVAGGRVEFFMRNTSGGSITNDFFIYFTPA